MVVNLLFNIQTMWNDIWKSFEKYNPNKNHKILIVFDDMIADILRNKNLIQ